jgi:hypothetical protein
MNLQKTWAGRACALAGMAMVATFASAGIAAAADIYNNLDGTIDAEAEVMALNVGGSNGTTTLAVNATGSTSNPADGKSGCNLTGSTTLGIAVTSSAPAVATASLSNATFTNCGGTKTITVHPLTKGTTTITVSQTTNNTGGTFDFAPATFTVNVADAAPSNTAPTIAVDGVDTGAKYEVGSVPDATCSVTDAEDGPSSFPATLTSTLDADGLGSQTAGCEYTDDGGLKTSASKTYSIVDTSAPVIDYTLDPATPDGDNDWYTGTVKLTWTVTETGSPNSLIKTGCVDQTIAADQLSTRYSCSASSSGGSAGPVNLDIQRDGNGPAVEYTSTSPAAPDGANGWYVNPVTATFTATDGYSGVLGSTTDTTTSSNDGSAVVLDSPAFTDKAGNVTAAGATPSPGYKIDTVDPDVPAFVGGPTDGGQYYFGSVPDAPSCTSVDDTSLLASCVVTGGGTAVGPQEWTATATDNAGNTSTAKVGYEVLPWTTKGFYSPVDMNGVVNTVKGGSTVPLKFELFAGPTELTDGTAVKSFGVATVSCGTLTGTTDAVELTTTGGTSLRYDATGGQFIQNWKTPTGAGNCYKITMTAVDGSKISALFKTK